MLLVVNYHYFRDPEDSRFPGIHGVNVDRFEKQISNLAARFEMITPNDFLSFKQADFQSKDYCLITFDDGLKEQYELGKPVLDKYGIEGVYFINGVNQDQNKVSLVHKIHWLRSINSPELFNNKLYNTIEENGINIPVSYEDFEPVPGQNIYDSNDVRYTKYLLNHILNEESQKLILNKMYSDTGNNEMEHAKQLYFDKDMIKELGGLNMIGSHGYEHTVKTNFTTSQLVLDVVSNQTFIKSICGKAPRIISYPYGGKKAVSKQVAEICEKQGLEKGFTMERMVNLGTENNMLFGRLDANDIPFGKSELISFDKSIIVQKPCTIGSHWF